MGAARGIPIFVYSIDEIFVNSFPSARLAGQYFNTGSKTILKYVRSGKIYKEKWILKFSKK